MSGSGKWQTEEAEIPTQNRLDDGHARSLTAALEFEPTDQDTTNEQGSGSSYVSTEDREQGFETGQSQRSGKSNFHILITDGSGDNDDSGTLRDDDSIDFPNFEGDNLDISGDMDMDDIGNEIGFDDGDGDQGGTEDDIGSGVFEDGDGVEDDVGSGDESDSGDESIYEYDGGDDDGSDVEDLGGDEYKGGEQGSGGDEDGGSGDEFEAGDENEGGDDYEGVNQYEGVDQYEGGDEDADGSGAIEEITYSGGSYS